jgi:hypothetical protein
VLWLVQKGGAWEQFCWVTVIISYLYSFSKIVAKIHFLTFSWLKSTYRNVPLPIVSLPTYLPTYLPYPNLLYSYFVLVLRFHPASLGCVIIPSWPIVVITNPSNHPWDGYQDWKQKKMVLSTQIVTPQLQQSTTTAMLGSLLVGKNYYWLKTWLSISTNGMC